MSKYFSNDSHESKKSATPLTLLDLLKFTTNAWKKSFGFQFPLELFFKPVLWTFFYPNWTSSVSRRIFWRSGACDYFYFLIAICIILLNFERFGFTKVSNVWVYRLSFYHNGYLTNNEPLEIRTNIYWGKIYSSYWCRPVVNVNSALSFRPLLNEVFSCCDWRDQEKQTSETFFSVTARTHICYENTEIFTS